MKASRSSILVPVTGIVLSCGSGICSAETDVSTVPPLPAARLAHLVTISIGIDGSGPYTFVVDTGAGVTVLSSSLAKALDLPVVGTSKVGSPMGDAPSLADSLQIEALTFGTMTVRNVPAVSMDLDAVFGGMPAPAGILAAAGLDGMLLTIDPAAGSVWIRPGALPPADGRRVLNYDGASVVPRISIDVAGQTLEAALDTGAPTMVSMPARFESIVPLAGEPAVQRGRTVDTEFEERVSPLAGTLTIGSVTFDAPVVSFNDRAPICHVGMGILEQLAVTIDRTNRRVAFDASQTSAEPSPGPGRIVRGGGQRRYGIRLGGLSGDVLNVLGADAGLPADAAGIRGGDRIVTLNGRPVAELSQQERMAALKGSPLQLHIERGAETIELTLTLD